MARCAALGSTDSEDLTREKLSFEELKKIRIYQKAFKYFTKKGLFSYLVLD